MKIALFASGRGSNVQAIIDAVANGDLKANLMCLICDKQEAGVIDKARQANIEVLVTSPNNYEKRQDWEKVMIDYLQERQVELIVLAGFMRILGPTLLKAYPNRIMNIHPSLLPAFPGRQAIKDAYDAQVKETGVTVHWVDEGIDTGEIIAQEKLTIEDHWDLSELEEAIHHIEHRLYPEVIGQIIENFKTKGEI